MSRPMSTAAPRPQLSLDELRRLKWLLGGGVALVSLWTVFFLDIEALGLVMAVSGVIAAVLIWPQLPARVPAVVWRLAVPAIVIAVAADFYASPDTLPVLIRLAVLLVLYRAVAYRRKREDLQLIVLGLFLVVVGGVLTVALEFAGLLLLFTAAAMGFLFLVTLIDMVDTGPKVTRPEELTEVPAWARGGWGPVLRRVRETADWRLLAFASVLFAGVVAVSAVLFLLIPRFEIGSGLFLDKYITRQSRTGFTETVRFGGVAELVQDNSVAMRVDVSELGEVERVPYFRMLVLDEYTPEGFRLSAEMRSVLLSGQQFGQFVRGQPADGEAVGGVWTFYVEPGVSRFLPLPGAFRTLRLRDPAPVQRHVGARLVALRSEPMAMAAFQLDGVELDAPVRDVAFARVREEERTGVLAAGDRGRYLLLTTLAPAGAENEAVLRRVVHEITRGETLDAAEFARRATRWLQARHAYALSANIPRGAGDGIVKWLDSNEPGFCEFFAGALAVLSRAAGHPARVVAGFRGGAVNAFENYIMVRNSDAHAWVEMFDGDETWFRVDPTIGTVAGTEAEDPLAARTEQDSSWRARLDSLRVLWYRRVVNFDTRQQVEMVEAVKSFTTSSGDALRLRLEEWAKRLKAWLAGPWDFARVGRVLAGLLAVGAGGLLVWRGGAWLWRRWLEWRRPEELDPVRREAGRELRRIAECEMRSAEGGLRSAEAGVRSAEAGVRSAEWARVRAELERLRFGRRETWPEPRAVFRRSRKMRRARRRRG